MRDEKHLREAITAAEMLREKGRPEAIERAAHDLQKVIDDAFYIQREDIAGSAIGHLLVCNLHLYGLTKRSIYVSEMLKLSETGLKLDIPDEHKAVFHLRLGQAHCLLGMHNLAELDFHKACELVKHNPGFGPIEYRAHLAQEKIHLGKVETGCIIIKECVRQFYASTFPDLREFHFKIIASGLLLKKFEALLKVGEWWQAGRAFIKGYALAKELDRDDKPIRLREYHAMLRKVFWKEDPKFVKEVN